MIFAWVLDILWQVASVFYWYLECISDTFGILNYIKNELFTLICWFLVLFSLILWCFFLGWAIQKSRSKTRFFSGWAIQKTEISLKQVQKISKQRHAISVISMCFPCVFLFLTLWIFEYWMRLFRFEFSGFFRFLNCDRSFISICCSVFLYILFCKIGPDFSDRPWPHASQDKVTGQQNLLKKRQ